MFKDPYATTAGAAYPMVSHIRNEIEKYIALYGNDQQVKRMGDYEFGALLLTPGVNHIDSFAHPLMLSDNRTIIDVRGFTRLGSMKEVQVNAPSDYNLALLRLALQCVWTQPHALPVTLLNAGHFQITVFSRWITQLLVRNFNLDPQIQMNTTAIVAYYYLCLFQEGVIDESTKEKLAGVVARATFIGAADVLRIIEPVAQMRTSLDLITALTEHGGSIRYAELNLGLLAQLCGGSWYGAHSREILSVALEHPPTFNAILYTVLNEHGYRNIPLGKLALDNDRGDVGKAYTNGIRALIVPVMKES